MPFTRATLALAVQGTKKIFTYESEDAVATVAASGYFDDAADEFDQFDLIHVVGSTGGTPTVDTVVVTSARGVTPVTVGTTEGVTAT